jgi:hypothetical protein
MPSILDQLNAQLGPQGIAAISEQLGLDPQTTQNAVAGAIPMLTGALARNAATPGGAAALHQALQQHDGSILEQAVEFLGQGGNSSLGAGILGHIFGGQQSQAANGLGQATGLDAGTSGRLLMMLAPLVLGALGRSHRQQGSDPGALAGVLQSAHQQATSAAPSGVLGALSNLLDANHDGSVVDEIGGMLGGLLGGRR